MVKDVFCVFYVDDEKYESLLEDAVYSFSNFHRDEVDVYVIKNYNKDLPMSQFGREYAGIGKYELAHNIWVQKNYRKCILLGADTITCAKLDEFLYDNKHDILSSLDYEERKLKLIVSQKVFEMVNADVVCFNNLLALREVIRRSPSFTTGIEKLCEQGALNDVILSSNFSNKVVDYPYHTSEVVYNVRAKGSSRVDIHKPSKDWLNNWFVKNGKLYTTDKKQIKVWHYCASFGTRDKEEIQEILSYYKDNFNKETNEFFRTVCQMPQEI